MKKDFIVRRSITMVEGKPHVETYSEQELIRCKDCHFYLGKGFCNRSGIHLTVNDDWFCADGEKK
jgi:hypothetical protein